MGRKFKPVTCSYCQVEFSSTKEYNAHIVKCEARIRSKPGPRVTEPICPYCGKRLAEHNSKNRHMKTCKQRPSEPVAPQPKPKPVPGRTECVHCHAHMTASNVPAHEAACRRNPEVHKRALVALEVAPGCAGSMRDYKFRAQENQAPAPGTLLDWMTREGRQRTWQAVCEYFGLAYDGNSSWAGNDEWMELGRKGRKGPKHLKSFNWLGGDAYSGLPLVFRREREFIATVAGKTVRVHQEVWEVR